MLDYLSGDVTIWFVVKIGALALLFIYIIFSTVLIRQVNHMTDTLEVGFEKPLRIVAAAHFLFAIVVFLAALLLL